MPDPLRPCFVLRCQAVDGVVPFIIEDEQHELEAAVCAGHRARMDAGDPWMLAGGSQHILMGDDLDAGGALVLNQWTFDERVGYGEMVIDCNTPSGKPHEPVRFVTTRDDLEAFALSFRHLFPDLFA